MMRVIVNHNNVAIKTYQFTTEQVTVGRLATNSIPINSMGVSRHHLKIERDLSTGFMIAHDLNSLNGSYINNQKIDKMTIQTGTTISLGKYSLFVEFTEMEPISTNVENNKIENDIIKPTVTGSITSEHEPLTIDIDDDKPAHKEASDIVISATKVKRKDEVETVNTRAVLIDVERQVIYKINKSKMIIASDKSAKADIFVESGMFSSDNIATITVEDGDIFISKGNGKLRINGKKCNKEKLKHKDRILVEKTEFSFMIKDS